MNRSVSVAQLAAALAKAQGEIEGASKDSKNPHFNSRYADLASVVGACREQLAKHELSVLQIPSTPDAGLVQMVTILMHASGEWIESDPLTVQAKDAGPQAVGSCLTYLRRYQLSALVGIAPEDDDAEAGEARGISKATVPAPRHPVSNKPGEKRTWTPPPQTEQLPKWHSFSTPAPKGFRRHGEVVPISRVNDRRIFETMKRAR